MAKRCYIINIPLNVTDIYCMGKFEIWTVPSENKTD